MKQVRSHIMSIVFGAAFIGGQIGCSMIDEDRSDCGEVAKMDYELELITNISTEVKTELNTQTDISLASSLTDYLGDIFSDFAHC